MPFSEIETVLQDLRCGKMVVLVDDDNRENEGDLVCAGESVTPEIINFMATHGKGWICLALESEICQHLQLDQMVSHNEAAFNTAFTVTIEARHGVTTGISAADRAHTMRLASSAEAAITDFVRPGHVQPIEARDGGVLVRAGQTEGSVDLARLAGLRGAGVICEIMNEDGTMARLPELEVFCEKHGLALCSVAQIIEYRRQREKLIQCIQTVQMPTNFGMFDLHCYVSTLDPNEHHIALTCGDLKPGGKAKEHAILLRVHSECLTGDVFHSSRCDCGQQLEEAMRMIQENGEGAIVYMRQEGRGIGLPNKIKAYALQEQGMDTVEANEELGFAADLRDYGLGAQILSDLGIHEMRLITNNPRKMAGLDGYGLTVRERVPLVVEPGQHNQRYLAAKRSKLGHLLEP
ncbi:MAG: bifunctional 3,4-dihydroxy-2-butanone-4-phosphate synthase/GTP cyclohydrolase II [Planctomycetota bacterium]|jgi:3,4-dihydroxy 2-butanone 4-phosphate synthase/GTP cyclohydrolase II